MNEAAATIQGLNPLGWALMLGCITCVCALCGYCFSRILREPRPSDHHHAPLDIDTKDRD